jgi:hypothetical protein
MATSVTPQTNASGLALRGFQVHLQCHKTLMTIAAATISAAYSQYLFRLA